MSKELLYKTKWWKFDFHNHTPASINDFGKRDLSHINISFENWLLIFMKAGIDSVAITDSYSCV